MLGLESTIDSPRWDTRFRHAKGGKGGGGSSGGGGSKGGGGGGGSKGGGSSGGGGGGGSKGGGGSSGGGDGGSSKGGGGSSPAKAVQAAVSYTKQGAPIASSGPSTSKTSSNGKTASSAQQRAQDLLAKFGAKVSAKEATKAQNQGVSLADLTKAANKLDVKIKPGAKTFYAAASTAPTTPTTDEKATADADNNVDSGLSNFDGAISLAPDEMSIPEMQGVINGLNSAIEANKAQIYADAQKFESLQATERTRIETKGKLDLQPIINAGLKDVQEIAGKYSVKQEETKQAGQKDIARISTRANILTGLVGAFNF